MKPSYIPEDAFALRGVVSCRQIEPHEEKILLSKRSKIETISVKTPINFDL